MKLKRLIIMPLVALVFSTINVLPAHAALGDDWDATASGLRESILQWQSSKISSNGSTQVAVGDNSIYVSTDSGNTWTNKYTPADKRIFDVELSDDGSTIIAMTRDYLSGIGYQSTFFVSKDSGETWSEKNPIGNGFELLDFALSGDGNKIFTVSNYGRFYSSLDSGDTWGEPTFPTDLTDPLAVEYQRYNIPGQAHDRWTSIDISSDGASLVIAGDGTGVKVSTDLGATWSFVINDRLNWKQVAFANNAATIIVRMDDQGNARGLIKISTDSGQSFSQASCGLTPETECIVDGFGGPIVWTNFATTADGSKIFAIGNNGGNYWGQKNFYVSTDNGVNWTLFGLVADYQWSHISSDASGNNLMTTSQFGSQIIVSNNSGLNWTAKSTGLIPASYYWDDIESSSSGQYMYANRESALFKSSDYGATWSNTNAPGFNAYDNSQIAITPNGATVLATSDINWYLCNELEQSEYCTTKLLKSSDYGQNWTTLEIPDIKYFRSISMSDDGQTLIINGTLEFSDPWSETYKTYVSRDAGQTWADKVTASEEDISDENGFRKTLISADGQKMVSSTYSKFFHVSTDFGDTWIRKSLPVDFDFDSNGNTNMAMTSDGSKLYAFMNSGLYVSQDMGTNWSETSIAPQPVDDGYADIKLNQDGSGILLADYNGKVLYSENSGQTWNTIFNIDNDYYLKSITAAQDFSTVAFGTETDIYVSHGSSFAPTSAPAGNNDSGPAASTPTPAAKAKVEEVKEKIKETKEVEEKEVIKPGTIAAAEPLIMRLIEDLPVVLKPQILNIFTEKQELSQILDSNKVLNILKDIVDKIVVDLPSLVRIGGEIQASRLVVVDNTTLQLVTADGGVLSVQANDGENPIPVDKSGKVQMVRSNGVETKGVGLSPNSEFSVYLFSDPTLLGVGKADAQGKFNASFLVDKDFPLGNHTLQINGMLANGKTSSISMPVSVVESVETATTQAMIKTVAEVKTTNTNFYLFFLLIMLALIGSIIVFKGPRFIYDQFKQRIE